MSAQYPAIHDADLGLLTRAESTFDDGSVAVHDWYAGQVADGDAEIDLLIDGTDLDAVQERLPRLRAVVSGLPGIRRSASDAIVTHFSDAEPAPHELDEGARDLRLEAIEATDDDRIILHFVDSCGAHFPDRYWPAAHLDGEGRVFAVTVES